MKAVGNVSAEALVLVLAIASILLLGAHQKRSKQKIQEPSYLDMVRLLELKISNVQMNWREKENITVKVLLTSKNKAALKIPNTALWYKYQISVVKGDGQPATKSLFLQRQLESGAISVSSQEIKPGKMIEEAVFISDLFDVSEKGIYKVIFKRPFYTDGKVQYELVSNEITFTVVQ